MRYDPAHRISGVVLPWMMSRSSSTNTSREKIADSLLKLARTTVPKGRDRKSSRTPEQCLMRTVLPVNRRLMKKNPARQKRMPFGRCEY